MLDDLFNRIRAAYPSLLTLTTEETALLEAWLGDHPEPPSYPRSEVRRDILSVWEETDPTQVEFWTLLRATLKHSQAETARIASTQPQPATTAPGAGSEEDVARMIAAIGDETTLKIDAIARRGDLKGEEKMRLIVRLDSRFRGKDSNDWATLLGVSPAAIRGYAFWKELRRRDKTSD